MDDSSYGWKLLTSDIVESFFSLRMDGAKCALLQRQRWFEQLGWMESKSEISFFWILGCRSSFQSIFLSATLLSFPTFFAFLISSLLLVSPKYAVFT